MTAPDQAPTRTLTVQELAVVKLIADGETFTRIAATLKISDSTVTRRVAQAAAKLGVSRPGGMVGAAFLTRQLRPEAVRPLPPEFTAELWDVLVRLARGRSAPEIASELMLSVHGVKSRIARLLEVLGASNQASAVRVGFECGALTLVPRQRSGAVPNRAAVTGPSEPPAAWQTRNAPPSASASVSVALRPSPGAVAPGAKGAR